MEWIVDRINKNALSLRRYKAGKPVEEIKRTLFQDEDVKILKLASNENLCGIDKYVVDKLKEEIENIFYYPDDSQYYLLEKLSKFYGVDKEMITLGNGAVELIRYIYHILVNKSDVIFSFHPTFAIYYIDSELFSANFMTYNLPSPKYQITSDDIINNLLNLKRDNIEVKVLVICSPNNPTGTIIFNSDLLEVLEYCLKNRIIVILDEAYFEFVDYDNYHNGVELVKKYDNLIVLRTFSKVFSLAGLRVGIAFANEYISKALNNVRLPFNVNTLAQKAVIYSIDIYERIVEKIKKIISEKYYIYSRLEKLGVDYIPSYANFIAIKVRDHNKVYEDLLRKAVIVRPASDMNMGSYIRVTISCNREDNDRFLSSFEEVLSGCP